MVVVAVVCVVLLLLYSFKVKERPEFTRVDQPLPMGPALRYTFTSRSFLSLVAANFMAILMNSLLLGSMFYLADYVLQTNAMLPSAAVFVPLLIGVPATQVVARRLGVVGSQQVFLLLAGGALVLLTFAPAPLILVCLALAGFGLAGPQTITNLLFAQVVDEDEVALGGAPRGCVFWYQRARSPSLRNRSHSCSSRLFCSWGDSSRVSQTAGASFWGSHLKRSSVYEC